MVDPPTMLDIRDDAVRAYSIGCGVGQIITGNFEIVVGDGQAYLCKVGERVRISLNGMYWEGTIVSWQLNHTQTVEAQQIGRPIKFIPTGPTTVSIEVHIDEELQEEERQAKQRKKEVVKSSKSRVDVDKLDRAIEL
jgi:hypothetical protein